MSNLVSVITPCFQHEQYLGDYFESLLAQSYRDIELIFHDDGSQDESWAVALRYRERLERRFRRVVLRRNEKNVGLLATLKGLKAEIQGDIVCILESDDSFYSTKVEENVAYLNQNPETGLVHSDVDFLYEKNNRLEPSHWRSLGRKIPVGLVFQDLLRENFILTCTMACRASLLAAHVDFGSYAERGYKTPDYPMFLDLSQRAPFGYIDRALAVYRVVEGSISHARGNVDLLKWKVGYYSIKLDYIQQYGCDDATRRRADSQYHGALMKLGWASGDAAMFIRGQSWFLEHDPPRVHRWPQRVRNLAVRNRTLWRAARWLEARVATRPGQMTSGFEL